MLVDALLPTPKTNVKKGEGRKLIDENDAKPDKRRSLGEVEIPKQVRTSSWW
jgi:hypothetical protein